MADLDDHLQDLDELDEDDSSLQDQADEIPSSDRRRIFTEKLIRP
jgi:hypothetical protein